MHFTQQILTAGPIFNAGISVSKARLELLENKELSAPEPVFVRALVDTGASCTCIDPKIFEKLELAPTGKSFIHTPSTGTSPQEKDQYDVSLMIPGPKPGQVAYLLPTLPVVAVELAYQGYEALIGRDILQDCILTYHGATGFFTLAF